MPRRPPARTSRRVAAAPDFAAAFGSAAGEQAWLEVIKKMDEVYHELLDYEVALEQKNAALEESQQFINSVLAAMSDVLIVCSRSGIIEDLNRSLIELTGLPAPVLRGRSILDILADLPSRAAMGAHLAGHAAEAVADLELQLRGAGGQAVPVALSFTPRTDSAGRFAGLVVTGRAVGELRRAYSALREAHDDLKRTQQQLLHSEKMASLGQLVAGVAHELNNPISFVLGNVVMLRKYLGRVEEYLGALEAGGLPPAAHERRRELGIARVLADLPSLLDGTLEGAERTRDVVDGLRHFSAPRAEAPEPIDLVPVLERAVHWVTRSASDAFRVTLALPAELPSIGSASELQQVFMNLVQNAVDATASAGPGTLEIHARVSATQIEVVFRDNGPGIPSEHLTRVFDPFFTTKPVGKGTGLGLSISYGIIERHGGRLEAASPVGGGAQFTVRLPARAG